MCLFLLHYALQGLEMSKRHCNAKVAFVLILSILRIFELLSIKLFVISSFLRRLKYKKTCFSSTEPSLPFNQREPLLPPKRASFFQKWEKWHFLLEKVCYIVIPHYLCIRKRSGNGQSRIRFHRVPSLCLRSGFALAPLLRLETRWTQNGMKKTSTLYKGNLQ